jgi:hypothetical protein
MEKRNAFRLQIGMLKEKTIRKMKTDGCTILRWILEIGWGGVDWINLANDRYKWRSPMNMVMNL